MAHCELLRAPIGAGKTGALIEVILSIKETQSEAPLWVLLPDRNHLRAFRERLALSQPQGKALFRVETLLFEKLYTLLLELAGEAQQLISMPIRLALIRQLLHRLQREKQLQHFQAIAQKPGLTKQVLHFIDELKQHRVSPERFAECALNAKDRELALVYREYQEYLREHRLIDRDGAGWLALAVLEKRASFADIPLFLVDGFDHFTPLQAELIAAVAAQVGHTLVTLPSLSDVDSGRSDSQVRRYQLAEERLRCAFKKQGLRLSAACTPVIKPPGRPVSLQHLANQLFRLSPARAIVDRHIHFLEASTPAQEIRGVLRRVKRQLLSGEARPDEIALILASTEEYLPYMEPIAREFAIPIQIHIGRPLLTNPAIDALLRCARLADGQFTRRELLEALQSPYTQPADIDDEIVAYLEQTSARFHGQVWQQLWLDALENPLPGRTENEEEAAPRERVRAALVAFFAALNARTGNTWRDYADWLVNFFGLSDAPSGYHLGVLARCEDDVSALPRERALRERDRIALRAFQNEINKLSSLSNLLIDTGNSATPNFDEELHHALADTQLPDAETNEAAVRVTTTVAARVLAPAHSYLIGLGEGIYPPSTPESPFYLSSEREDLRKRDISLREEVDSFQQDGIFYQLAISARQTLTLSRPFSDDGKPRPASAYWQAVAACFTSESIAQQSTRVAAGVTTAADVVASHDEAFTVLLSLPAKTACATKLRDWVTVSSERQRRLAQIQRAASIEARRLSAAPYDQYSGRLWGAAIRAEIAAALADDYEWSVSQLNEFARCGFRFFARRILALTPLAEEEEDEEATLYGSLTHLILQRTYEPFLHEHLPIEPAHLTRAQEVLLATIETVFSEGDSSFITFQGRKIPALLAPIREYITRQLSALIDQDFSADSPFQDIGNGPRYVHSLELSFKERIVLGGGAPRSIQLRGKIDRVDRIGDTFVIVDYKSGNRIIPRAEIEEGLELQLPFYLLAAQRERERHGQVALFAAFYWHTRSRKRSAVINSSDGDLLARSRGHVRDILRRARAGNFSVNPAKPDKGRCVRYCPYFELCRLVRTSLHKSA